MKKLHFGHGIAIFYTCFAALLGFFLYTSMTFDHKLVADDYYQQDLAYQSHKDAVARTQNVDMSLIQSASGNLVLRLPDNYTAEDATVSLMRPDARVEDISLTYPELSGATTLETDKLMPGRWNASVSYQVGGAEHFKDFQIYLK